jgi:hypothetical protein
MGSPLSKAHRGVRQVTAPHRTSVAFVVIDLVEFEEVEEKTQLYSEGDGLNPAPVSVVELGVAGSLQTETDAQNSASRQCVI